MTFKDFVVVNKLIMSEIKKPICLEFPFQNITEEEARLAREFFDLCYKKFMKGERKHDYVRGKEPYKAIYNHLLCEFGELIWAFEGDNWERGIEEIVSAILDRKDREKDRDIVSELADVTNIPVLVYICGKIQGAPELERAS